MPPTGTNDIDAAEAIRTAIEMEGPDTVAAVIGEPVSITEFRIPDADYWVRVREICDEYGVLLIIDETVTGCCRSGRMWAIEHWNVVPDVMIVAKSLSGGYAPIAAMVVREHVYEAFGDSAGSPSVQSYGGHGRFGRRRCKGAIHLRRRANGRGRGGAWPDADRAARGTSGSTDRQGRAAPGVVGRDRAAGSTKRAIARDRASRQLRDRPPRHPPPPRQRLRSGTDVRRAPSRLSPYVSTEEDIEFVLQTIPVVLDGMEGIVLGQPER